MWAVAAVVAIGVGIGIAIWRAPDSVDLPLDAHPRSERAPASRPPPMPAPPTMAAAPATPPPAPPPPGVSAEQWRALSAELAGRPGELKRLEDYYTFADRMQRFRALRTTAPPSQLLPLAGEIDRGIDERLAQREMSADEARLVKSVVLEVLVPDEAQRAQALASWEDGVRRRRVPDPAVAAAAAREAEFKRRQDEIVAAWSARPPAQRDPLALERELDALRRATFDTSR